MASPLSRLRSKTFPGMTFALRENTNYEVINQIGNGAYGTVYKARDLVNEGKFVAMKKIKIPLAQGGVHKTTLREIAILKQLDRQQHPNIVKLLDVINDLNLYNEKFTTLCLVFEHIEQDLASYMARCPKPGMSSDIIKSVMRQILSGVDFLNCNRVVHRDLKPQNILVSSDFRIKIADFGLAKVYDFDMKLTSVVVTLWYRAPEVLLGLPYVTAVDVWACGCIMGEMYKLTPLFDGETEAKQLDRIFRVIGLPSALNWPKSISLLRSSFKSYSQTCWKTLIPEICSKGEDLIMKLLMFDSTERMSARTALKHPYLSEL